METTNGTLSAAVVAGRAYPHSAFDLGVRRIALKSSGAWGRGPGDYGRTAYFTTDGATAQAPDGVVGTAKLLRLVLPSTS